MTNHSDLDMESRLAFIGLTGDTLQHLESVRGEVEAHLPAALHRFYEKLAQAPEVARFFSGSEQMARAEARQVAHWSRIASGNFSGDYVEASRRVGERHAQIGLEPRWYIGGYGLIVETLIKGVVRDFLTEHLPAEKRGLFGGGGNRDEALAVGDRLGDGLSAMVKAMLLDVDIAVTVYMDRVMQTAAARDREHSEHIERAATLTGDVLRKLAAGDLTQKLTGDLGEGFERIRDDVNTVIDSLSVLMERLGQTSRQLRVATSEILSGANDLSERTTREASTLQQTASSMETLAETVGQNAHMAEEASRKAEIAATTAEQGGEVMSRATVAMTQISESSGKISSIIGLIDDIAFQTNLLALNASVEAARAGDAGKGFAVVAVEVRRLAQSAANASADIKALIQQSGQEVESGSRLVAEAAGKLQELLGAVQQNTAAMSTISQASHTQATSIAELTAAMRQMDETTQHNAALVEEINAAIEQTEAQAAELDHIVEQFKVTHHGAGAASPRGRRAASPAVARGQRDEAPRLKRAANDWNEF